MAFELDKQHEYEDSAHVMITSPNERYGGSTILAAFYIAQDEYANLRRELDNWFQPIDETPDIQALTKAELIEALRDLPDDAKMFVVDQDGEALHPLAVAQIFSRDEGADNEPFGVVGKAA